MSRHSILAVATIATLTATWCADTAAQSKQMTSEDSKAFKRALTLADKTNNRTAIGILRGLYDKYPDNVDVAYNLGICYINASGNPDSTLFFLKRTAELSPETEWTEAKAELMLATARAEQLCGRPEEALKIYDDIDAKDTDGLFSEITDFERATSQTAQILMRQPTRLTMRTVGNGVNSAWNDYRPILTEAEDTMYFTSRRPKETADKTVIFDDGQFEEGIYMSVRNGNKWDGGKWGDATAVTGLVADRRGRAGQETATSIAKGGTEMYLCHDGDIFVSLKDPETGKWRPAEPVRGAVNTEFNEDFAYVTANGEEMYFSSDAPGGLGGKDIWLSRRLPNGDWGEPTNLGPGVNTEEDEDAPFFHEPTNVLYFSSMGHSGMGGYDIFFSPRNDKGEFEASRNMGYPINSADDDIFFSPSADHGRGYYASIRWKETCKSPSYDIYEVEFEQPEQNTMAVLAATVKAQDPADVRVFTIEDGEIVAIGRPNAHSGRYVAIVQAGGEYDLMAVCDADTLLRHVKTLKSQSYYAQQRPVELDDFVFETKPRQHPDIDSTPTPRDTDGAEETDTKPYTVQLMSIRQELRDELLDRNIEIENVTEHKYRDGWYVYSYGSYATFREARKAQNRIRETTHYRDAFARNKNQYLKFIESDNAKQ